MWWRDSCNMHTAWWQLQALAAAAVCSQGVHLHNPYGRPVVCAPDLHGSWLVKTWPHALPWVPSRTK